MAINDRDPHNLSEYARVLGLSVRAVRREARGKSSAQLEARIERIRSKAQKRENQRTKR